MSETNPLARQVIEDILYGATKALRYYEETGAGRRAGDRTIDAVIHDYDDVDLNTLKNVLREDLPKLIEQLRHIRIASC